MIASITDPQTFKAFRSNAQTFRSGPISIRFLNDAARPPRVAFAIGRRYGNAVARNRARRRVTAVFRETVKDNPELTGTFLVSVRRELALKSYEELRHSLSDIFEKTMSS